jgi:hypothetical protein
MKQLLRWKDKGIDTHLSIRTLVCAGDSMYSTIIHLKPLCTDLYVSAISAYHEYASHLMSELALVSCPIAHAKKHVGEMTLGHFGPFGLVVPC